MQARINRVAEHMDPPKRRRAETINEDALLMLAEWRAVEVRGRMYRIDSVPMEEGVRLQRIQSVLHECGKLEAELAGEPLPESETRRYFDALREGRAIARRLLRPMGRRSWVRRLLWRAGLHDPTADATEAEIGSLVGFFSGLRTQRRVRFG